MKVVPCFVDETGAVPAPDQPVFAVGGLIIREVCDLTDSLYTTSLNFGAKTREHRKKLVREIRENKQGTVQVDELERLLASTRHHEYKFSEIREWNIKNYIAFLRVFFQCTNSEFHCIVIERSDGALKYYGDTPWSAYVHVTAALLAKRLKEPTFVCADWQTRPKRQNLRLEEELCRLEHVAGCIRMTSEMSVFLQVTDLLLGVVSFDWRDARGKIEGSNSAKLKREVVDFVKGQLKMKPTDRFLPPGRHYFRRATPIAFTAWQPVPMVSKMPRTRGMSGVNSRGGMTSPRIPDSLPV